MIYKPDLSAVPRLIPWPDHVAGVNQCVIRLDDGWKRCDNPPENYWESAADYSKWADVKVPDDVPAMLRLVKNQKPLQFAYKRLGTVPREFAGKRIILRFEGAQGFVSVWVDGHFAGKNDNGFLTWDLDISGLVTPGQPFLITAGVENHTDDVIGDNLGGLVRPVSLVCVPQIHITRLHVETVFDEQYQDAILNVMMSVSSENGGPSLINLKLTDPVGKRVPLEKDSIEFNGCCGCTLPLKITSPLHWDAEHPFLYTLEASLYVNDRLQQSTSRRFGFRQVKICGNRMLINGMEVKLRGACRHDITAHHGHTMERDELERDIKLFKEANINYIRTSHYPPYEDFLNLCDQYGIYIEDETAFAFIGSTLKFTPKSPHLAQRFIDFEAALIERDRSHPSVIIWSLANESIFGRNFALINRYAHLHDPSRPTKFSYPMTMHEEDEPVDIWSVHYNGYNAALNEKNDNLGLGGSPGADRPILNDEYAHLAAYNREELRRDPAIRSFWGAGIYRFWDNIWHTQGALGGAIWAGIDHTPCRMDLDHYEWGIVDIWRRKKPEFWYLKKAYSPVRVLVDRLPAPMDGWLEIPVENRFSHTDFSEMNVEWEYGTNHGNMAGPDVAPFHTGVLRIQINKPAETKVLHLKFYDSCGWMVEDHAVEIGEETVPAAQAARSIEMEEKDDAYLLQGACFSATFSKSTGLFSAAYDGDILVKRGPFLNLTGIALPVWELASLVMEKSGEGILAVVSGRYGKALDVTFRIHVDGNGRIATHYTIDRLGVQLPWAGKIRVGVHCGGLSELGVYYILDGEINRLAWKRKGLHTVYPQDHISRLEGVARREQENDPAFGEQPAISWSESSRSYFLNGIYDTGLSGTNDFRSTKHHIHWARAFREGGQGAVRVISDTAASVRMEVVPDLLDFTDDRDERIRFTGTWYRLEDSGCFGGTETISRTPGDFAEYTFCGTGIAWIGSVDTFYGIAKIYIDGRVADESVNNRVGIVDFAGSAIGYDKQYRKTLFSINNLKFGEHTLRVEVTGNKGLNATDSYVSVDCFQILHDYPSDEVKMIINSQYNYPGLSWGNAILDPVLIETGSQGEAVIQVEAISSEPL